MYFYKLKYEYKPEILQKSFQMSKKVNSMNNSMNLSPKKRTMKNKKTFIWFIDIFRTQETSLKCDSMIEKLSKDLQNFL